MSLERNNKPEYMRFYNVPLSIENCVEFKSVEQSDLSLPKGLVYFQDPNAPLALFVKAVLRNHWSRNTPSPGFQQAQN
jgi:hypothetical protein